MNRFYVPSNDLAAWQNLLAQPTLHWKDDYSAKLLAESWHNASGFPASVAAVFNKAGEPFASLELRMIFPEHQVPLPGGQAASQTDAWVLASEPNGLVSIAVEGKVAESCGPTVSEWLVDASEGKNKRLTFLTDLLGLSATAQNKITPLRYQLFHRTASALIEARRYHCPTAVMLIHSFSAAYQGFNDYADFVALFGATALKDELVFAGVVNGRKLYFAWVGCVA